jgi:hypothetical protein
MTGALRSIRWLGLGAWAFAALLGCSGTCLADDQWHWVRVEPSPAGWEVLHGAADVEFDGRHFTTRLDYVTEETERHFDLKGRIDGDRVIATEVQLGADAAPATYWGTILRERTPQSSASRGWGADRIVLTSGAWFLGLYRQVRAGRGPRPPRPN